MDDQLKADHEIRILSEIKQKNQQRAAKICNITKFKRRKSTLLKENISSENSITPLRTPTKAPRTPQMAAIYTPIPRPSPASQAQKTQKNSSESPSPSLETPLEPLQSRTSKLLNTKLKKIEKLKKSIKKQKEEEEFKECTFKPKINKRSKRKKRGVQDLMNWHTEVRIRRCEQATSQQNQGTYTPRINTSRQLEAEQSVGRQRMNVVDRLMGRQRLREAKIRRKREEQLVGLFTPKTFKNAYYGSFREKGEDGEEEGVGEGAGEVADVVEGAERGPAVERGEKGPGKRKKERKKEVVNKGEFGLISSLRMVTREKRKARGAKGVDFEDDLGDTAFGGSEPFLGVERSERENGVDDDNEGLDCVEIGELKLAKHSSCAVRGSHQPKTSSRCLNLRSSHATDAHAKKSIYSGTGSVEEPSHKKSAKKRAKNSKKSKKKKNVEKRKKSQNRQNMRSKSRRRRRLGQPLASDPNTESQTGQNEFKKLEKNLKENDENWGELGAVDGLNSAEKIQRAKTALRDLNRMLGEQMGGLGLGEDENCDFIDFEQDCELEDHSRPFEGSREGGCDGFGGGGRRRGARKSKKLKKSKISRQLNYDKSGQKKGRRGKSQAKRSARRSGNHQTKPRNSQNGRNGDFEGSLKIHENSAERRLKEQLQLEMLKLDQEYEQISQNSHKMAENHYPKIDHSQDIEGGLDGVTPFEFHNSNPRGSISITRLKKSARNQKNRKSRRGRKLRRKEKMSSRRGLLSSTGGPDDRGCVTDRSSRSNRAWGEGPNSEFLVTARSSWTLEMDDVEEFEGVERGEAALRRSGAGRFKRKK